MDPSGKNAVRLVVGVSTEPSLSLGESRGCNFDLLLIHYGREQNPRVETHQWLPFLSFVIGLYPIGRLMPVPTTSRRVMWDLEMRRTVDKPPSGVLLAAILTDTHELGEGKNPARSCQHVQNFCYIALETLRSEKNVEVQGIGVGNLNARTTSLPRPRRS